MEFSDLENACPYQLRPITAECIHPEAFELFPMDDWPLGRNDSVRLAAYFSGGELVYVPIS
jgi:hypothetical protein